MEEQARFRPGDGARCPAIQTLILDVVLPVVYIYRRCSPNVFGKWTHQLTKSLTIMQISHILVIFSFSLIASAGVCDSGIYKALAPLTAYPSAQAFCSERYPRSTITVTVTNYVKHKRWESTLKTSASSSRLVVPTTKSVVMTTSTLR